MYLWNRRQSFSLFHTSRGDTVFLGVLVLLLAGTISLFFSPQTINAKPHSPAENLLQGSLTPRVPSGGAEASSSVIELTFGFWNLENLFDTEDDPRNPGDNEFLPERGWDEERYHRKLERLAKVIESFDVDLLGVCEIENRRVLEDLLQRAPLSEKGYGIAHLDSPDKRGIDMGVIYRAPLTLAAGDQAVMLHEIDLGEGTPKTRGIFEANFVVDQSPLLFLVQHWPSRRGGEEKSRPHRIAAAQTARRVVLSRIDSAAQAGYEADILLVGDFNDDPYNVSLVEHLEAVRGKFALEGDRGRYRLFNPSWKFLGTPDVGTLYYQAGWNVFDQAIVSRGMLDQNGYEFVEGSLQIYNQPSVRNLNHPAHPPWWFRKYRGNWTEGFSDHFAVLGTLRVYPKSP